MSQLTFGSLFAGVGGFDIAFERAGMKCVWQVEIDKKCQEVLRRHFPDTLLLGDIRDCGKHNLPPVDVIAFGSPCQDLSVAGKGEGLNGERSGLFFEATRIIRELRPTYAIWENVPGAFSSNDGRDFGAVLDELAESGAVDIGWRVLDAQWFGVAQRRRRVFVVADFRGRRAAKILSIPEGLSGDSPPSRETREGVANGAEGSVGSGGSSGTERIVPDITDCLYAAYGTKWNGNAAADSGNLFVIDSFAVDGYSDYKPSIGSKRANGGDNGGGSEMLVVARSQASRNYRIDAETETLLPVFFSFVDRDSCGADNSATSDTLQAHPQTDTSNVQRGVMTQTSVRRLTPTECERLQGFPDNWTFHSDSTRYMQLGNAVCVPVAEWIGRRIVEVDQRDPEVARGIVLA